MTLSEQAYEHLRKMIINNELSYQEIYSETKIAKEIGVSRTPFRDAIHRLVQEGYIDIIPSKGFSLHQLTKQDVDETFQVRSALECYATVVIAKQSSTAKAKKLFRDLDKIMDKLKEILQTTKSIEDFSRYDFQFHVLIINYLNNERFTEIFNTFMYRMQKLAALSLAHTGRMQDTYDEHIAILEGMKSGDAENIYEITIKHMEKPRYINLEDL